MIPALFIGFAIYLIHQTHLEVLLKQNKTKQKKNPPLIMDKSNSIEKQTE